MLSHLLGQAAHADAGEVIDGEARVARDVHGEEAIEAGAEEVVSETGLQRGHAEGFGEVLEEDLDEDAAAGGGVVFVQVDDGQDVPADGVGAEQVPEEAGDIAESVGLVAVDGVVVFGERGLEEVGPKAIELGKALSD